MKNKFCSIFFVFFSLSFLFCEDMVISLPTEKSDVTVYLCDCIGDNSPLKTLANKVLTTDFVQDGRAIIFEKTPSFLTLEKKKGNGFYQHFLWKKNKIHYAIIPSIKDNSIQIEIFNVRKGSIQTLSKISFSEKNNSNIMALHKISDFLFQEIFSSPGIASKKILYSYKPFSKSCSNNTWTAEIYETDSLGLFHERKTFENSYCISPEFLQKNPGNKNYSFVYVSYKIGQPQIYLGKTDGSKAIPLIKLRGNQLLPKTSYDGKYLSFVSDASGSSDIFIQPLTNYSNTKPIQIYSGKNQTSASPHLSPDNSKLVFVNDKTGCAKIYIADIKNTLISRTFPKLQRIKSPCSECTCPCFSPDGKKIVFSGKVNGRRQIWLYDINKKTVSQLTSGSEDKENPSFGSDSIHIVYNTTSPSIDLFLLNSENRKIRRLTKGSGEKHYPAFEK